LSGAPAYPHQPSWSNACDRDALAIEPSRGRTAPAGRRASDLRTRGPAGPGPLALGPIWGSRATAPVPAPAARLDLGRVPTIFWGSNEPGAGCGPIALIQKGGWCGSEFIRRLPNENRRRARGNGAEPHGTNESVSGHEKIERAIDRGQLNGGPRKSGPRASQRRACRQRRRPGEPTMPQTTRTRIFRADPHVHDIAHGQFCTDLRHKILESYQRKGAISCMF